MNTPTNDNEPLTAQEQKRRRLAAWRLKQQQQQQSSQSQTIVPPRNVESSLPPQSLHLPKPTPKVSLSLGRIPEKHKKRAAARLLTHNVFVSPVVNRFGDDEKDLNVSDDDDKDNYDFTDKAATKKRDRPLEFFADDAPVEPDSTLLNISSNPLSQPQLQRQLERKKGNRWDSQTHSFDYSASTSVKKEPAKSLLPPPPLPAPTPPLGSGGHIGKQVDEDNTDERDALDHFMDQLQSSELQQIKTKDLAIHTSGTMSKTPPLLVDGSASSSSVSFVKGSRLASTAKVTVDATTTISALTSGGIVPSDQLFSVDQMPLPYTPSDWMSDNAVSDDEEEEQARRVMIEALKISPVPLLTSHSDKINDDTLFLMDVTNGDSNVNLNSTASEENEELVVAQLAAQVKSEKTRRAEHLKALERQAEVARSLAEQSAAPELGRLFNDDVESGVMEEAERDWATAQAAPDALQVLAELNKKKELCAVDHANIDYLAFTKNLYRVPRVLAALSNDEVVDRRAKLKVRVRGHGAPAPVTSFEECGLSEKILDILHQQGIDNPFPVQAQCIPCIMAGRDVIGIAKTGSGKTLAYLLPLLRHIMAQPPLKANESGPIGLILAPARELAYQIHTVCKAFTKLLGLNPLEDDIESTAVYGGAGVADQIGDLKRGTHIVVATPGRLIDILTMQSGKVLSLRRVTYVVMDEADRMYDMGFAPQISAIHAAIRPDRQSVLFSATFPKSVEALARKSLQYAVEVVVGGRSVASDSVTQYAELVEEEEKFLRLLQLLGEHAEPTHKVIIFVDTQVHTDALFEQLLRNGYSTLSLHGGMEQEDRDSTISDFKRKDGPDVLVATGVAGRGLDVPSCKCVINFSSPNHLEAYVHQVGRTGRAGNKGVAYTFVNSTDEAKYAPVIVRALSEAGQSENVQKKLKHLAEEFKEKVEKGEARYAGSGFRGKGYTYDSTELSESQKVVRLEKRQVLIEAGMLDPEDNDDIPIAEAHPPLTKLHKDDEDPSQVAITTALSLTSNPMESLLELPENLTPELLALPGMKEALLRKAGIKPVDDTSTNQVPMTPEMVAAATGRAVMLNNGHWLQEFEINNYPREARWKVTQRETTSKLQDEFRTAVTLKGSYFPPGKIPDSGERRLYLHLEATNERSLQDCALEIQRLLNEETLRRGKSGKSGSTTISSHKYSVL